MDGVHASRAVRGLAADVAKTLRDHYSHDFLAHSILFARFESIRTFGS